MINLDIASHLASSESYLQEHVLYARAVYKDTKSHIDVTRSNVVLLEIST